MYITVLKVPIDCMRASCFLLIFLLYPKLNPYTLKTPTFIVAQRYKWMALIERPKKTDQENGIVYL